MPRSRSALNVERSQALGLARPEQTPVGCGEGNVFPESALETEGGGEVNGIEAPERMPLDQVAGQQEELVPQVHSNVGLPIAFKLPTSVGILDLREKTFPLVAYQ